MTELKLGPLRFGIVGAGRLGTTVARALQARGFEVVHVASRSEAGREAATHALAVPAFESVVAVSEQVDCVLLCVPDDAVGAVVQQLVSRPRDASPLQLRIVSTSANTGIGVLEPLHAVGHEVGVLHPVATVSDKDAPPDTFVGAGAAVGAASPAMHTFLEALAHALGMHPFDVAPGAWPLHAAACTLSANGVGALLAACDDLALEAGMNAESARAVYSRLARRAVDASETRGAVQALAGPILRGDAAALARQIRAVRASSTEVDALFIPIVASVANRAFTAGRIDMPAHREILEAVLDPSQFDEGVFRYRSSGEEGNAP